MKKKVKKVFKKTTGKTEEIGGYIRDVVAATGKSELVNRKVRLVQKKVAKAQSAISKKFEEVNIFLSNLLS
jgi:hypothetical protein